MTLNLNSGFHWKFYNKIQFSPQFVIHQHEIKFFYCLLQWPSRSVTRRRQVPKIRSSAFSFGQRHYELHASNEVYVCQCRLSRNNSFRSCCQENEAKLTWNVICFLSPFLLKGCAIVPLAQIDFDFFRLCLLPTLLSKLAERKKKKWCCDLLNNSSRKNVMLYKNRLNIGKIIKWLIEYYTCLTCCFFR